MSNSCHGTEGEQSKARRSVSDESLALEVQAGSLAAFEDLVTRYENRIYGFVFQMCRDHQEAQEITQDCFLRAYQSIARYDPKRPFISWLFAIARNKCIDFSRKTRPLSECLNDEMPDPTPSAFDIISKDEERTSLWNFARRNLSADQFQVLWLCYAENMAIAQIAAVLGKTQVHVKVLLFRARKALLKLDLIPSGDFSEPPILNRTLQSKLLPNA